MTLAALRRTLALFILLQSGAAPAQVSTTVSIVSDYRVRGVSLSDGRPEPQLTIAYDHPQGWYGGLFGSGMEWRGSGHGTHWMAYGGFARLLRPGLSWEAGLSNSVYPGAAEYNYGEGFIGLALDQVSARLSYAPRYFGDGARTLYAELNGGLRLTGRVSLSAHAGVRQAPVSLAQPGPALRADARLGLDYQVGQWKWQLAWLAAQQRSSQDQYGNRASAHTVTLGVGYEY
ncbi:MAG: TorF family putative porin [Pseudomonadota bacterium]